jgi:hypothetical protein
MRRPDLRRTWRQSLTINDFVDNLTDAVKALPPKERAAAYRDVLNEISPELEQSVRARVEQWIDEGEDPAQALRVASLARLIGRRQAIFRTLIMDWAPKKAAEYIKIAKDNSATPAEAAGRIDYAIEMLRPPVPLGWDKDEANRRLREVFPDPEFRAWAVSREPTDAVMIREMVEADVKAGVPPEEALQRGVTRAVRDMILDRVMSQGVSAGPDYCVVAAVISAAAALVGIGISVWNRVEQSQDRNRDRDARDQAARDARNRALESENIDTLARYEAQAGSSREAALVSLRTMIEDLRDGRTTVNAEEERRFIDTFNQEKTLIRTQAAVERGRAATAERLSAEEMRSIIDREQAAAASRRSGRSMLGTLIGVGLPVVGLAFLASSFLKNR